MEPIFLYFLKVNVVLSILFFAFWLLLRNENFFQVNRVVLHGICLLSFSLPTLSVPEFLLNIKNAPIIADQWSEIRSGYSFDFKVIENMGTTSVGGGSVVSDPSFKEYLSLISFYDIAVGLYSLIIAFLLIRFIGRLIKLYIKLRKSEEEIIDSIHYCAIPGTAPFSFFRFLVIDKTQYEYTEYEQIVEHEKVHIRQWHSLDILFIEIVHILFWINPVVLLLKRCLKLNLEFIADEKALDSGIDPKSYQFNILNNSLSPIAFPLTNLFFSPKIKHRIKMINSKKSSIYKLYKYAFILPVTVFLYFAVGKLNANNANDVSLNNLKELSTITEIPTSDKLKEFEGYYHSATEKDVQAAIKITAKGDRLILKELWTGNEVVFQQQAELEFLNKILAFPLKFTKDKNGRISEVLAFNRDVWKRTEDFKPVAKKEVKLTPSQLKALEGYYQFEGNKEVVMQVLQKGNELVFKEVWSGVEAVYIAESPLKFFNKDREVHTAIEFLKDDKGAVTKVDVKNKAILNKIENYTPKKEIKLSIDQLKQFEGKYSFQFEKGKDEFIVIKVIEDRLMLTELWTGREIPFVAESELNFYSPKMPFPLEFKKDNNGKITQVLAFGEHLWNRVQ